MAAITNRHLTKFPFLKGYLIINFRSDLVIVESETEEKVSRGSM